MTTSLTTARLALRNALAAYHFHAFEGDPQEAEYWWGRYCYWQRIAQELEEAQRKSLKPGGLVAGPFFNIG